MAKKKKVPETLTLGVVDDPAGTKPKDDEDPYAGVSLAGAQARFRDLVEEACDVLPIDLLGGTSRILATFLDGHLNDRVPGKTKGTSRGRRTARLCAAEDAEKTEMGQWWQEFARKNADIHRA